MKTAILASNAKIVDQLIAIVEEAYIMKLDGEVSIGIESLIYSDLKPYFPEDGYVYVDWTVNEGNCGQYKSIEWLEELIEEMKTTEPTKLLSSVTVDGIQIWGEAPSWNTHGEYPKVIALQSKHDKDLFEINRHIYNDYGINVGAELLGYCKKDLITFNPIKDYDCVTYRSFKRSEDTEFECDQAIDDINEDNCPRNIIDIDQLLARGKDMLETDNVDVMYMESKDKFTVTVESAFLMPTGDGGTYWEREIDSFESYTPREFGIHLDKMEDQAKPEPVTQIQTLEEIYYEDEEDSDPMDY